MTKNVLRVLGIGSVLWMQSMAAPYSMEQIEKLAEQTARQAVEMTGMPMEIRAVMEQGVDPLSSRGAFNGLFGSDDEVKPYRIIHLEPKGWVIVATDDRVKPILGYSVSSTIGDTLPPAMEGYLAWASDTISNYLENGEEIPYEKLMGAQSTAGAYQGDTGGAVSSDGGASAQVGPLLQDNGTPIQWGQGEYFNRYTPKERRARGSLGGHTPVGCGATAMGQIMRYWQWPKKRKPIPGYKDPNYGRLNASDKLTYDWSQMPAAPSEESQEISRLLFDAGIAQKMTYGASGSWSSLDGVRDAFRDYFRYSDEVGMRYRSDYNAAEWASMIQEDLSQNRPVFYRGADHNNNNGHFFVVDGYKKKSNGTEYHINWGWHPDGSGADGWFALDDLTPIRGANFTGHQMALVHVFPDRPNTDQVEQPADEPKETQEDAPKAAPKETIKETPKSEPEVTVEESPKEEPTVKEEPKSEPKERRQEEQKPKKEKSVQKKSKKKKTHKKKQPKKERRTQKKPRKTVVTPQPVVDPEPIIDDEPTEVKRPEPDPVEVKDPQPVVKQQEQKRDPFVEPAQPKQPEVTIPTVEHTPEQFTPAVPEEVEFDTLSVGIPDFEKWFDFDFGHWFDDFDFGFDSWF